MRPRPSSSCTGDACAAPWRTPSRAVENRLTARQLATLAPGDAVTVDYGMEFGRRRHATATVVRVDAFHVTGSCLGPRESKYVERYGLWDGLRVGGAGLAEVVRAVPLDSSASEQARQAARIQELFRA